jgi:hypothetical protein
MPATQEVKAGDHKFQGSLGKGNSKTMSQKQNKNKRSGGGA